MKKLLSAITRRGAALSVLSVILAAAILYQCGMYELPFITRTEDGTDTGITSTTPHFSDGAVENTDAPPVSSDVIDSLNSSANISTVSLNDLTSSKPYSKAR